MCQRDVPIESITHVDAARSENPLFDTSHETFDKRKNPARISVFVGALAQLVEQRTLNP